MKKLLLAVCLLASFQIAEAQLIRSSQTLIAKTKEPVKIGLQQEVALEGGGFISDMELTAGINYTIGYRFNQTWFLGAGIGGGYESTNSDWDGDNAQMYSQFFADIRAYLTESRIQPFLELNAGFCGLRIEKEGSPDDDDSDGGLFIAPQFGIHCRLSGRIGVNVGIGAKMLLDPDIIYPQIKVGLSF